MTGRSSRATEYHANFGRRKKSTIDQDVQGQQSFNYPIRLEGRISVGYLPYKGPAGNPAPPKSSPAAVSTSQCISLHPLTFSSIRLQIKSVQTKVLQNVYAETSFETSCFVMMIHSLRLRITFSWICDEMVEGSLRWETLHSEFRDESTVEVGILLIGLLRSMPHYSPLTEFK